MAAPQSQVAVANMAYRGQPLVIDDIPKGQINPPSKVGTVVSQYEDYVPTDIDMTDLSNVNLELNNLRIRLHRLRIELRRARREAVRRKFLYETEKKRVWIGMSGGSDKSREAAAELLTEQLYTDYLVAQSVADELNQHSRDIRSELDSLREISNNLRRQIDLT